MLWNYGSMLEHLSGQWLENSRLSQAEALSAEGREFLGLPRLPRAISSWSFFASFASVASMTCRSGAQHLAMAVKSLEFLWPSYGSPWRGSGPVAIKAMKPETPLQMLQASEKIWRVGRRTSRGLTGMKLQGPHRLRLGRDLQALLTKELMWKIRNCRRLVALEEPLSGLPSTCSFWNDIWVDTGGHVQIWSNAQRPEGQRKGRSGVAWKAGTEKLGVVCVERKWSASVFTAWANDAVMFKDRGWHRSREAWNHLADEVAKNTKHVLRSVILRSI